MKKTVLEYYKDDTLLKILLVGNIIGYEDAQNKGDESFSFKTGTVVTDDEIMSYLNEKLKEIISTCRESLDGFRNMEWYSTPSYKIASCFAVSDDRTAFASLVVVDSSHPLPEKQHMLVVSNNVNPEAKKDMIDCFVKGGLGALNYSSSIASMNEELFNIGIYANLQLQIEDHWLAREKPQEDPDA